MAVLNVSAGVALDMGAFMVERLGYDHWSMGQILVNWGNFEIDSVETLFQGSFTTTSSNWPSGSQYGDPYPTGTVGQISYTVMDQHSPSPTYKFLTQFTISGLSFDLTTLMGWVSANNTEAAWSAIFAGNDTLNGNSLADVLIGYAGADSVSGGAGADRLEGREGADSLFGGDGADVLVGGADNDAFDGGAGSDTASYNGLNIGVTVDLRLSAGQDTNGAGVDTFHSVENLGGGGGADRLIGQGGANSLTGWNGADVLDGLGGRDVLYGGYGADLLYGGAGADVLFGNGGNDTLEGGEGNDHLWGLYGNDRITYATATAGVTVDLGLTAKQDTVGAGQDTLHFIENLTGSAHGDRLTGSQGANRLDGGAGDDQIRGDEGADRLTGGDGLDRFVFDKGEADGDYVTDFDGFGGDGDRIVILNAENTLSCVQDGDELTITWQDTTVETITFAPSANFSFATDLELQFGS